MPPPTNAANAEEAAHHQKARFFLVAWAVASVVGVGTAVFAALAGGKVGLFLPQFIIRNSGLRNGRYGGHNQQLASRGSGRAAARSY